jgi:hypothetical protein
MSARMLALRSAILVSSVVNRQLERTKPSSFIFITHTDSQHKNPLCRVTSIDPPHGVSRKLDYDKEKYKEMILDAAETVLGYFGFDRGIYGNKMNIGPSHLLHYFPPAL